MKRPFTFAALCSIALLSTSCSSPGMSLFRGGKLLTSKTNVVQDVVSVPARSETVQTPSGPVHVTVPAVTITNWSTNVVFEIAPTVTRSLDTIRALNAAVPTPAAPFVDLGSWALSLALGGLAAWKTRRASQAASQAGAAAKLVETVIAGVEAVNDPALKQKIRNLSRALGTEQQLHRAVKSQTEA